MKICPDCFSDKEIKGFIFSLGDLGKCSVCGAESIYVIDISELLDFFQELVENLLPSVDGIPVHSFIQKHWDFFSSDKIAQEILKEVLPKVSVFITEHDDKVIFSNDITENFEYWDFLKKELKWSRRFISDIANIEDLGWDGFFNTQFTLTSKDVLYRARVHHQSGLTPFEKEGMFCPRREEVNGGRANPAGIPYLYLSDNPQTVLYEVRASYLDELSIATFKLKNKTSTVKIVDFTEETSLFQPSSVNETIKGQLLRNRISVDLSKPMRRYDSEVEYIPTQFICEFIKVFTGASGIRFNSSLHPSGKNIVIFDQELMKCEKVELKRIDSLKLTSDDLK